MGRKAKIKAARKRASLFDEPSSVDVKKVESPSGRGSQVKMSFRGASADHAFKLWMAGKLDVPKL